MASPSQAPRVVLVFATRPRNGGSPVPLRSTGGYHALVENAPVSGIFHLRRICWSSYPQQPPADIFNPAPNNWRAWTCTPWATRPSCRYSKGALEGRRGRLRRPFVSPVDRHAKSPVDPGRSGSTPRARSMAAWASLKTARPFSRRRTTAHDTATLACSLAMKGLWDLGSGTRHLSSRLPAVLLGLHGGTLPDDGEWLKRIPG